MISLTETRFYWMHTPGRLVRHIRDVAETVSFCGKQDTVNNYYDVLRYEDGDMPIQQVCQACYRLLWMRELV